MAAVYMYLGLLALIAGAWAVQKPNIIHMVVDDWGTCDPRSNNEIHTQPFPLTTFAFCFSTGHADVGYTNSQIKTPFINSLAADGAASCCC